jgi:DNA-binding PadR family transcriptional regulator
MSAFRYAVLGLLAESPDHGYRLRRRFDDRIGSVWHLNPGQVYQTLRTLEEQELIRAIDDDGPTARGRKLLESWLRKPPTRPNPVRDETLVRLMVLESARPEIAAERIRIQEHLYREHMTRLAEQVRRFELTGGERTTRFGLEAAILHTEAHLRWLEYCRLALEDAAAKAEGDVSSTPGDPQERGGRGDRWRGSN